MRYRRLGCSNIIVSELCLGVLTIGPLQKNLLLEEGAGVIAYALERGITFLDTAEAYKTYKYIKEALVMTGLKPVIASKSYAYTGRAMKISVEKALDEMGLSNLDIFLLHEQENEQTLRGHEEALRYLLKAREKGMIKAVGLSTHTIAGVRAGSRRREIEIIHPLINIQGLGIIDGTRDQMLAAIKEACQKGKGLYAMKAFGGGNLVRQAYEAFQFINHNPDIHSTAIGMKNRAEIDLNIAWSQGRRCVELEAEIGSQNKKLLIEDWCHGCGSCVEACHQEALSIIGEKVYIEEDKCILCGYCSQYCVDFCIKII